MLRCYPSIRRPGGEKNQPRLCSSPRPDRKSKTFPRQPRTIRTIHQPRKLSGYPGTPFRQACQRSKPCEHWIKPTFASVTNPSGVTLPNHKTPANIALSRLHACTSDPQGGNQPRLGFPLRLGRPALQRLGGGGGEAPRVRCAAVGPAFRFASLPPRNPMVSQERKPRRCFTISAPFLHHFRCRSSSAPQPPQGSAGVPPASEPGVPPGDS